MNPPHRIGARQRLPQPTLPERSPSNCLQGIEAAQASPVKNQNRLQQHRGRNAREETAIRDSPQDLAKVKDLFRVSDQSSENRLTPSSPAGASTPNRKVLQSTFPSPADSRRLAARGLPTGEVRTSGAISPPCVGPGRDRHAALLGRNDSLV